LFKSARRQPFSEEVNEMVMVKTSQSDGREIITDEDYVRNRSCQSWIRWLLPVFVGLILFCNHYSRDCPGALEKPIENELSFTQQDYSILNSLYFVPNIISPLIAGMFIDKLGGIVNCFYLSLAIASLGHICFGLGATWESKGIMYLGKGLSGSMYEIIDAVMPIVYLSVLFKDDFQIVIGFLQIFIRLGSVVNFIISPYVYQRYGLLPAIWIASGIGISSIGCFFMSRYVETSHLITASTTEMSSSISSSTLATEKTLSEGDNDQEFDAEIGIELVTITDEDSEIIIDRENQYTSLSHSTSTEDRLLKQGKSIKQTISNDSWIVDYPVNQKKQKIKQKKHEYQSLKMSDNSEHNPLQSVSGSHSSDFHEISVEDHLPSSSPVSLNSSSHSFVSSSSCVSSLWNTFLELTQFHQFSLQYYLYLIAGAFLYGSIVPFWFYGSKYFQDNFNFPIDKADSVMTLPEGLVVITGFPFGILMSKIQPTVQSKLLGFAAGLLGMSISFCILIYSAGWSRSSLSHSVEERSLALSPDSLCYGSVIFLGISFSCSCGLFWGIVNDAVDHKYLNQGSGILSCAVNILPAVLPPFFAMITLWTGNPHSTIIILAIQAFFGSIAALFAALQTCTNNSICLFFSRNFRNDVLGDSLHQTYRDPSIINKQMSQ
jgi:hypothetical protein